MISDPELLGRIESFEFDEPGTELTFAVRLARENGWTDSHARRVIREYLRFVYLSMVAGRSLTPSDAVDQAWHLHLSYTVNYWRNFCGGVLGRRFEHNPTKGGADERAKFFDAYESTLAFYRMQFQEEAPRDLWPPVTERFLPAKTRKPEQLSWNGILIGIVFGGAIFGFNSKEDVRVLCWLVAGIALAILLLRLLINISRNGPGGCGGGGCGTGCGGAGVSGHHGGDSGCGSGCGGGGGGD